MLSTALLPQIHCIVGFSQTAENVFIIHFKGNITRLRDRRWVEKKEKEKKKEKKEIKQK